MKTHLIAAIVLLGAVACSSDDKSDLIERTPRGIMCLHCNQPQARPQARELADMLVEAKIDKPAFAFLVDGTFGYDQGFMEEIIDSLSGGGRTPHIAFYLANGPSQRRCKDSSSASVGLHARLCPEDYRSKMRWDTSERGKFVDKAIQIKPLIERVVKANGVAYVSPSLEDNHTKESFDAVLSLLRSVKVDDNAHIFRNACPGCYPGNNETTPEGVLRDQHTEHQYLNTVDGLVSNDGREFTFPGQGSSYPRTITFDNLRTLMHKSSVTNNVFLVWKAEWAGLTGGTLPDPVNRSYAIPTEKEKEALIQLLRE